MTGSDLAVHDVIDALDSFYCHNVIAALWADAVANRLEGMALYLLGDELREVADHARGAARRLADRIGDLGGAITADPRQLIDRAPGEGEFTIPDCSDPRGDCHLCTAAPQHHHLRLSGIPGPGTGARRRELRPRGQTAGRRDSPPRRRPGRPGRRARRCREVRA